MVVTPSPAVVHLSQNSQVLKAIGTLSNGNNPSNGAINFYLYDPSNNLAHFEAVIPGGNGSYTTPTGFTLTPGGHALGNWTWEIDYTGDTNNLPASNTNTVAVQQAIPTPAISVASASVPVNSTPLTASVDLSGTVGASGVTGAAGIVTFTLVSPQNQTVDTETANVNGDGTYTTPTGYTLPNTGTATGTYQWNVSYSGDTNNTAVSDNNDANGQVTVTKGATQTTLVSSSNPALVGQPLTFTATVTPSGGGPTPTGTVTFKDGGTTIGASSLNSSGVATLPTSSLAVGHHVITASYGGDGNYVGSPSLLLAQNVTLAGTVVTLQSSANPATFGGSVTLTAQVTSTAPGTPGGSVIFAEGSTVLGTAPLNASSSASITVSLAGGNHPITATYSGDTAFSAASGGLVETIQAAATSTTLSSSQNPVASGGTVVLNATVTSAAGTPDGAVTFLDGSTVVGTGSLDSGGHATLTTTFSSAGPHTLSAMYQGDLNFAASTSSALAQTVVAVSLSLSAPTTSVTVTPGQNATFVITATPGAGGFPAELTFALSGLPAGVSATFDPPSFPPGNQPVTTTLTVSSTIGKAGSWVPAAPRPRWPDTPLLGAWLAAAVAACLWWRSRGTRWRLAAASLLCGTALLAGCGSADNNGAVFNPSTHSVTAPFTVTATSGQGSASLQLSVTVQQP
jgi:hypothetical protein